MVAINLKTLFSTLLALSASASANPHPNVLLPRVDCTGVAPSPGGQPCSGTEVLTCIDLNTWSCPDGTTGAVPAGTQCICSAFRNPGWVPNNAVLNPDGSQCTAGIVCTGLYTFRVCGVSGLEAEQQVPPGTICSNGGITWP